MLFILKADLPPPPRSGEKWGLVCVCMCVCVCGLSDGNKELKITMPILVDAAGGKK